MGILSDNTAYYIEADQIRVGVVVRKTEPTPENKKLGAQTLYEFGHGYSTPQVFRTEKEAREELEKIKKGEQKNG